MLEDILETRMYSPLFSETFTVTFYQALQHQVKTPVPDPSSSLLLSHIPIYDAESEYKRLGLNCDLFSVSYVNITYSLCPSYPSLIVVPREMEEKELIEICKFRSKSRLPVPVWKHFSTGAVLVRCSQPTTGVMGKRCKEDERLLEIYSKSSGVSPGRFYLFDARSMVNAYANSLAGAGVEGKSYVGCTYQMLNISNIHAVRRSFLRLRKACIVYQKA